MIFLQIELQLILNMRYILIWNRTALQFTLKDIPAGYNQLIVTVFNAITGAFTADLSSKNLILSWC